MQQRIVCAANKLADGTVILGVRHWDLFMHKSVDAHMAHNQITDEASLIDEVEQGFIDQHGRFLTRREAWDIATEAGQIVRTGPGFNGPELYSENLY